MAEAGWEQPLFPRVAVGGQAPRGYIQPRWTSDKPENCPQDNKEPDSSVNLYPGQSAHSGGCTTQASQPQGLSSFIPVSSLD